LKSVHQKPGFRIPATLADHPDGNLRIQFQLPGGPLAVITGPAEPSAEIADTNVMYYPDQFIQIIVLHRTNGLYQMQIPVAELPPHTRP
jgi:hypothetical protein